MYHSVIFENSNGSKWHTWDDWHIVPSSRPVVPPPSPKTKTVDIPGGDGLIDLTTSLTGFPVFDNRADSIEFIVLNDFDERVTTHEEWHETYSKILRIVHGKKLKMYLEDDPDYFYEGRFTVDSWTSNSYYSNITIGYDVKPYKYYKEERKTGLWAATTTEQTVPFYADTDYLGVAPTSPTITVSGASTSGVSITFNNPNLPSGEQTVTQIFKNGSTVAHRFIFYGGIANVTYKAVSGTATVQLSWWEGQF